MKKPRTILSVTFLLIGLFLYISGVTKFELLIRNIKVFIYPAAFFILLGGILGLRELLNNKPAE
jgi:hypothetical protein